jgi:hypothetical protein
LSVGLDGQVIREIETPILASGGGKATAVASAVEGYIPTLDTVTARPYGDGWYFYRYDSAGSKWVNLQRDGQTAKHLRQASAFAGGEPPSFRNAYGAAPRRGTWQMTGAVNSPSALPDRVNALAPKPRALNPGYGLSPDQLSPIEHIYTPRQPGQFTTSFQIANELAFDPNSSIVDRTIGLVGGTVLFVPMVADAVATELYNSVDNAGVAGQILAQGQVLGGTYEAEYNRRAAGTFGGAVLGVLDVTGLAALGRKTAAVGVADSADFALSGVSNGLGGGEPMIRVYRGTSSHMEWEVHLETGHLMSDAARLAYKETGSLDAAYEIARGTHDDWLKIFGSERKFGEAHGLKSSELQTEYGLRRTFMSVTEDIEIARNYSKGQHVFTGLVPKSSLLKQTIGTSNESEYLVRFGSEKFTLLPPDL